MKESVPNENFIPEEKLVKNYSPEIREKKKDYFDRLRKLWTDRSFSDLITTGYEAVEILPQMPEGDGDSEISGVYMLLGSALWETEKNAEKVFPFARKSVQFDRKNKGGMWLLRECNSVYSEDSQYMRIQVKGKLYVKSADEFKVHVFHAVYGVVADSPEQAMKYIREFEREEVCDTLEITNHETAGPKPELPQGIYAVSELIA